MTIPYYKKKKKIKTKTDIYKKDGKYAWLILCGHSYSSRSQWKEKKR